jgi:type I restriction enzyme M protein
MLSVLRTNGMLATVMPHGVLFRGSVEKEIRKGIVEDDLLEAVIGLPPNLFYGTGIPACILVCRSKGAKPDDRKNRVLFINADAEFHAGRAQNYLRPEHIEKIASGFEAFDNIPGYASIVHGEDLESNDWNLNIRRYADNAPLPEPHDVRAHLVGGVPKAEVEAKKDLLSSHGLRPETVFVERDADYYDFDPAIKDRGEIKHRIDNGKGVQAKEKKIKRAFEEWWQQYQTYLVELPNSRRLMEVRSDLLDSFVAEITPVGLLDRFKVAGVIATWWNENQYDLKALVAQGFEGLVDGWVETIAAGLEENSGNHLDEMADDPLVLRLLPDYLAELEQARQEVVDLEQEKEAFEAGESDEAVGEDTSEEGERPNYAKELKDQIKELRHTIDEYRKLIKALTGSSKKAGSIAFHKARGEDTKILEAQLKGLEGKVRPVEVKVLELEMRLKPYDEILEKLKAAKKELKDLQREFLMRLNEAREALSKEDCRDLVLDILKEKLESALNSYVAAHRQLVVAAVENCWDKYRVTLKDIEKARELAVSRLDSNLKALGYTEI